MSISRNGSPLRDAIKGLRNARWLAVLAGIFVLGLVFSQLAPAFLQLRNIQNILVQAAVTGVMAIGMTFVIMTAGIDISVGGILYLTLVLATEFSLKTELGQSAPILIYLVAVILGSLLGLVNGLLINYIGINPLITTLATLTLYRGLAIHINQARITIPNQSARFLGIGQIAGVPAPLVTLIVIMLIGGLLLRYTRFGRYALAIGSSKRSAVESELPVKSVLLSCYAIGGFLAGLAGMILLGRVGAVQTDIGIGIEFTVITAVVLGGTLLSGGNASMLGSVLGAIFLVMIDNGLNLIHVSAFIYDIVRGGVLVGAVLIDRASSQQILKSKLGFLSRRKTEAIRET
jgi:ribose transport system permease protein